MRKFIIIGLLVLGIILAGLKIIPSMMGERIFEKVVSQRIGANPLDGLDDGLHVILIGTGSPQTDPTRAEASTAVIAGDKIYIVDMGDGAGRKMSIFGIPQTKVEAALITHFHSDHISGLGSLMFQRWAAGGHDTPLPVYGPTGIEDIVEGFNQVFKQDRAYRIAHHGEAIMRPQGYGAKAMPFEPTDSVEVLKDGELTITAFQVNHEPVAPAMGYRFTYKGRTVSITGDTATDPSLAAKVKGSDILISEVLNSDMVGVIERSAADAGLKRGEKIMSDIPSYHITPEEAASLAQEADVDKLVFTHIVPALPNKALYKYFLGDAPEKFDGDIVIGEDGMLFSLPAGSDEIKSSRLD